MPRRSFPMKKAIISFAVLALLTSTPGQLTPALTKPLVREGSLKDQDKQFLEGLLKNDLFDPKGAQRVSVMVILRSVWGGSANTPREGWLVNPKGHAPRVFFTDGDSIAAPAEKEMTKIDYVAACRKRYETGENQDPIAYGRMRQDHRKIQFVETDLANAAWLYRLGQTKQAAKTIATLAKPETAPPQALP